MFCLIFFGSMDKSYSNIEYIHVYNFCFQNFQFSPMQNSQLLFFMGVNLIAHLYRFDIFVTILISKSIMNFDLYDLKNIYIYICICVCVCKYV